MSQTDIQCVNFVLAEEIVDIIRKNITSDISTKELWNEEELGLSWLLNSWTKFLELFNRVSIDDDPSYRYEKNYEDNVSQFIKYLLNFDEYFLKSFKKFALYEAHNNVNYLDNCSDAELSSILGLD